MRNIYKEYYKNIRIQKQIIDKYNFTYRQSIYLIDLVSSLKNISDILDLGCGVGTLDFYLSNQNFKVTAVDNSIKAINFAKINSKYLNTQNIKFVHGDLNNINISGKFDLILCFEVIEHISNDAKIVRKMADKLSSNGFIILTTPLIRAPLNILGLTKNFDKRVGHLRRYNYDKLYKVINSNSLEIVKCIYGEGLLRNSLFVFKVFDPIVHLANYFKNISNLLTFVDNIFLKIFGASNIYLIIKKK